MAFILAIIAFPFMFVQGVYNTIFDGLPIPFSDHVGKVVEVAPIANSQKVNTMGEWEEKYSQLFIGEKVVFAINKQKANFKKITTFQKYEVIREKLKTGRVLGNGSRRICILNNLNDSDDFIREDCDKLDEMISIAKKYRSILHSIKEGKVSYFAIRDVNSKNKLKRSFQINDYNIYELKDENQLNELIKFISEEDDFPHYVNLSKLKDLIFLSKDDLKNDKVLSQLTFIQINEKLVTKNKESEKSESEKSNLIEQENFIEKHTDLNEKIAIRIYFNYFNQYFKKHEKLGGVELTFSFKALEEIRNCLIRANYFVDYKTSSDVFKKADNVLFNTTDLQNKYSFFLKRRMSYTIDNIYNCNNFHKFSEIKDE